MRLKLNHKIKGGALYLAIFISIVIGIFLSLLFLLQFYFSQNVSQIINRFYLEQHLSSALAISNAANFGDELNKKWFPLNEDGDSAYIDKKMWGSFFLVTAKAKHGNQSAAKVGLYGCADYGDTALYVSGNNRTVKFAGTIEIFGKAYLPGGTYQMAYIDGSSGRINEDLKRNLQSAPESIIELDERFIKQVRSNFNPQITIEDSVINELSQTISNSFYNKTIIYQTGNLVLDNINLKGNIKIICNNTLTIKQGAKIEDVFVVARKIIVEDEYEGAINMLASDTIIIGKKCKLLYPSSVSVFADANQSSTNTLVNYLGIGEETRIAGAIINYNPAEGKRKAYVKLNDKVEVKGLVYSSENVDVRGTIEGNVFTKNLLLQNNSGTYSNHLYNVSIDCRKLKGKIVLPNIFKTLYKNKTAKWLD